MNKKLCRCFLFLSLFSLCAGCSKALIRAPLALSNDRWQIMLEALKLGPDQYNTAGGYWEPRKGKRFVWATIRIRNGLKTGQTILIDRIMLTAGGKRIKPFIIDMNTPVTMRANPAPLLAPGETVSRKLIYITQAGVLPEKMTYEKKEIIIPAIK